MTIQHLATGRDRPPLPGDPHPCPDCPHDMSAHSAGRGCWHCPCTRSPDTGALCATAGNPDDWFPTKWQGPARAQAACRACPARVPCLRGALRDGEEYGIWGGLDASELEAAARDHTRGVTLAAIIARADHAHAARDADTQAQDARKQAQDARAARAQRAQQRARHVARARSAA